MAVHTFPAPGPLAVELEIALGAVRVEVSDREDAVVEVRPTDPHRGVDVRDAEQTMVEHSAGTLVVRAPQRFSLFGRGSSVDVTLRLPTGSSLRATAALAHLRSTGRLGETTVKLGMGDIRCEDLGPARLSTGMGEVSVDHVCGPATVSTGSGAVRLAQADGAVVVKSSDGPTWLGTVAGDVRVRAANGDITVAEAGGGVDARSANGDVRVLGAARGSLTLKTAAGGIDVGIQQGSAAWLDVSSSYGTVTTALEAVDGPGSAERTLEVHARTGYGDVSVHRA